MVSKVPAKKAASGKTAAKTPAPPAKKGLAKKAVVKATPAKKAAAKKATAENDAPQKAKATKSAVVGQRQLS